MNDSLYSSRADPLAMHEKYKITFIHDHYYYYYRHNTYDLSQYQVPYLY